MQSLYGVLNDHAKRWWYYAKLRAEGMADDARRLEREAILSMVRTIRSADLFFVGSHGFIVHTVKWTSEGRAVFSNISGYGDGAEYSEGLKRARPGIPRVDTRTAKEGFRVRLAFAGPMAAMGSEKADPPGSDGRWGGFHKAPMPIYLAVAEAMGATVHWGDFEKDREEAKRVAGPTVAYLLE